MLAYEEARLSRATNHFEAAQSNVDAQNVKKILKEFRTDLLILSSSASPAIESLEFPFHSG